MNWFQISKLKTDSDIWQWFYVTDWSSWSADNLEIYNYIHHDLLCNLHISSVQSWLKIDENWEQNDLMIISDMFEWMFKFESESFWIMRIMTNEFNMYAWHL